MSDRAGSQVASPRPKDGHGWWPYLGPYALFLALVEIGGRLPESVAGWWLPVKVVLPALLLAYFVARGRLPELRGYRPGPLGALLDIGCGVLIAVLWVAPFLVFSSLPRAEAGDAFDPDQLGASLRGLVLGVRLIGFAGVTPFVEELFVRSFLIRFVEVYGSGGDFRKVPIGRFGWASFIVTVLWFVFTHVRWEWPVALVAGVIFNLWLYRRRHIGSVIVAHAAANASIWIWVVALGGDWIFL